MVAHVGHAARLFDHLRPLKLRLQLGEALLHLLALARQLVDADEVLPRRHVVLLLQRRLCGGQEVVGVGRSRAAPPVVELNPEEGRDDRDPHEANPPLRTDAVILRRRSVCASVRWCHA
jgi:hypothetical protein